MYPYQASSGFNSGPMGPPPSAGYYEMTNTHPSMALSHPPMSLPHPPIPPPHPPMAGPPHHVYFHHSYYPHGPPQFTPLSGTGNWSGETPPASNGYVSSRCMSPMIDTPDDRSEVASDIYEPIMCLQAPTGQMTRSKTRASDTCSVDSGYTTSQKKDDKIKWSTSKKELPNDPVEAKRIIKRRQRNREATAKSRSLLVKRAQRGDRLYNVLTGMGTHFKNIFDELQKLHLAKIGEELRIAGVDTVRLMEEMKELQRKIKEVKDDVEKIDSS